MGNRFWDIDSDHPNAGTWADVKLMIEKLKQAGITDPTEPDTPWKLLDYVEKLLEIENWEGTGDSGALRFIRYRLEWPSHQYITGPLLMRIWGGLWERHGVDFFEDEEHEFFRRQYALLFKGCGKVAKEVLKEKHDPEEIKQELFYIFDFSDAWMMVDHVEYGDSIVDLYDAFGIEFYFGMVGFGSPWWHTVDLVIRLHTSGRLEDALDVCRIAQRYFPLADRRAGVELGGELQDRIQEQFGILAELMIQTQGQQKELLDAGFNTLRNLFKELLENVRSAEGVSTELIAKAESIEQVLNGVVENIAKVRNTELNKEEMISLLEDITIPISVESEVEELQTKYRTIDNIGREFTEELAKCDYILKQDVAGMISDLMFLKLCKTLESLLIHSIVIHEGDLKMLSDSETPSQKQLGERIGKAEQILRSHLEGNRKLTLGSLIPLLDAIKDDECEDFVLLSELRKIHQDSLGDIRDVKHFISKPGQIGDDTKPIVEMRNVAAHSILEEGVPISEEHVKRLRLKLLEEAPHVLEIISRILNENK